MKYIITDKQEVVIGMNTIHRFLADHVNGKVIAAGHCRIKNDGTTEVWGNSIGYGIHSKPEDAKTIDRLKERTKFV